MFEHLLNEKFLYVKIVFKNIPTLINTTCCWSVDLQIRKKYRFYTVHICESDTRVFVLLCYSLKIGLSLKIKSYSSVLHSLTHTYQFVPLWKI